MNDGLGIARSYYARTALAAPRRPTLQGAAGADLCIVGGGCTGLAAALFAAQKGLRVVLLEGGRLGWGASGRNGGQIIPGLRLGPEKLLRRYGPDLGKSLFTLAVSARDLVQGIIGSHQIPCDLALTGHLQTATRQSDLDDLRREADIAAERMDYPHLSFLDRAALASELASDAYRGALLDARGGHFHPLNYALGLARAAEQAGARLYEDSAVLALSDDGAVQARTAEGSVTAPFGIVACDALLGRLDGKMASRIMPIASHIVTTAPLPPGIELIPNNRAVSDSFFAVNYFRLTPERRLLFGGGERYFPGEAKDIGALVRPPLERIFPQLRGIAFDSAWGGMVSVTTSRLPDIGRFGRWLYAQGYSGQGAILSSLAGQILAEVTAGTAGRFDLLRTLQPAAFPGGTLLRTPLHLLGMIWYALRDRLG